MEAVPQVQDTLMVGDEPQEAPPGISSGFDGTTEIPVNENVKGTTLRTVIPSVSDVPVDGEGFVTGMEGLTAPIDHRYKQGPESGIPREYPSATVPRNHQYGPPGGYNDFSSPSHSEAYASLNRGARMDDRYRPVHPDGYRTLDPSFRAPSRNQLDPYAAQPQVGRLGNAMEMSTIQRFVPDSYGLEDDQRSVGFEDSDYGMGHSRQNNYGYPRGTPHRTTSYEGTLDRMSALGEMFWSGGAPLARGERGSMASIDSIQKRGPGPGDWRKPELSEVITMLNYPVDAVKVNAAAYLQHLTYMNEKVKYDVRRLKGIPAIVSLLDHPNKQVHFAACGALRNISFGKDPEIKKAIENCDGIFYLSKLLMKTNDQALIEIITGTLWNLSSQESLLKGLLARALQIVTHEVLVPHSGLEQRRNGAEGNNEEVKFSYLEWEKVLTNVTGFLRNVSSGNVDERKKIRAETGLIDSVVCIIKSQTEPLNGKTDPEKLNSKLTENCVCVLRNLSYHLHSEIPNHEHYKETPNSSSIMRGSRFSSRKSKRIKDNGSQAGAKTPAKGWELLCQPDMIEIYGRLLASSTNRHVLEASAGAVQNLCAGNWTYGREIRAKVMENSYYTKMVEYLDNEDEIVVQAMSGALCNLALDQPHATKLGSEAVPKMLPKLTDVKDHPSYSEQTRMAMLSALYWMLGQSPEVVKQLVSEGPKESQELYKLVQLKNPEQKNSNRYSEREVEAVNLVLQKVWDQKEVRRALTKKKYKKTDFVMTKKKSKTPKGSSEEKPNHQVKPKEKTNPGETDRLLQDSGPTLNQDGQLDTADMSGKGEK